MDKSQVAKEGQKGVGRKRPRLLLVLFKLLQGGAMVRVVDVLHVLLVVELHLPIHV